MAERTKVVLAGTLAVVAALLLPAAATATFPGGNGKIVFVRDLGSGNTEVVSMDADGSHQTDLSNDPAADGQTFLPLLPSNLYRWDGPSISPDGSKIAFTSTRSGNRDIWVMDMNGTNQTKLTTDSADDYMPAWSADGSEIVFQSDRGVNPPNLWQMDPNGANQTKLPSSQGAFQPDALPGQTNPSIYGIEIPNPPAGDIGFYVGPSTGGPSPGIGGITSAHTDVTPELGLGGIVDFQHPTQEEVYYASPVAAGADIYRVAFPSGTPAPVTASPNDLDMDPAMSPDGTQFAWADMVNGQSDFDIYIADNSGVHAITANNVDDTAPEWQPRDIVPPDTQITSGPTGPTAGAKPTFQFTSTEANSTFECSIDDGTPLFRDCSGNGTHTSSTGLSDGAHTFRVRAIDAAGNPDPSPATRSFTVDTRGPEVAITKQPKSVVKTRKRTTTVKIAFATQPVEAGATFKCKLDTASEEDCASPFVAKVKAGSHTITVTATDAVGNAGSARSASFKVVRKKPHHH